MSEWADRIDRLRLVRTDGVGPVTYRRLLDRYHSPAAALDALPRLAQAGGRAGAAPVVSVAEAERELEGTNTRGGRIIFLGEPDYPPLLAMMEDAPPCLIVCGDAGLGQRRCVAAVGGRNASANGQRMAETLAAELAATVVVVSGLARGIDTAAHVGAMRTGRTIAVVAGGIDQPYPPENADLHRRIGETHLLITESPIGTLPQARHFPRRNRIIAGL
jgi:DNA processing protein